MFHNSDILSPQPIGMNPGDALPQAEGGVDLDQLPTGAVIDVETDHHTYRVENRGDGRALISGHPKYCPEPVLVDLHGATAGYVLLKMRFIGRGMRMEFRHPVLGVICTSRVREIHEPAPAGTLN